MAQKGVHIDLSEFMNSSKGVVVMQRHVTFREIIIVGLAIVFAVAAGGCCVALIVSHTVGTNTTIVVDVNVTDVCTSHSCFISSTSIVALRNLEVDPCDNFYKYACGNWQKYEPQSALHPDEREKSMFHLLEQRAKERIQKVLATPSKSTSRRYERQIKDFYSTCIDDYQISKAGAMPFINQVLKPAGGWQAIPNVTRWDSATYQLTAAMKKVHVDFWKDALFHVRIGPDWVDYTKHVVEVKATEI